jgi:hypothetical protein
LVDSTALSIDRANVLIELHVLGQAALFTAGVANMAQYPYAPLASNSTVCGSERKRRSIRSEVGLRRLVETPNQSVLLMS